MCDNLQERGPRDRSRRGVNEERECRYWSEELDVSPEALKEAVAAVGPGVEDVERHRHRLEKSTAPMGARDTAG